MLKPAASTDFAEVRVKSPTGLNLAGNSGMYLGRDGDREIALNEMPDDRESPVERIWRDVAAVA